MAKKKQPLTPWEKAKAILRDDYLNDVVTDAMKPKDVYESRQEYKDVKYANFRNNFSRLKRGIKENQERANSDEAGYLHDINIYTLAKDSPGYWDGSEAQHLLKTDLKAKVHERMKPKLFWNSRPQYREFDLAKFRGHIHQELRSERETTYWIYERKKKEDGDIDFYDPVIDM